MRTRACAVLAADAEGLTCTVVIPSDVRPAIIDGRRSICRSDGESMCALATARDIIAGMLRILCGLAEHLLWAVVGAVARVAGMVLGRLAVLRQQGVGSPVLI